MDRADMSPAAKAERIAHSLLAGSGPIVLVVPGTRGSAYDHANLETLRELLAIHEGPVAIASVPYEATVGRAVQRFIGRGPDPADETLAHLLRRLHVAAPGRPIYLIGQSQGSLLIADVLNARPELGEAVKRVVLFSRPATAPDPPMGRAPSGRASTLGNMTGAQIVEFRHDDDIVTGLLTSITRQQVVGLARAVTAALRTGRFDYTPHRYEHHAREAAEFLMTGRAPTGNASSPSAR